MYILHIRVYGYGTFSMPTSANFFLGIFKKKQHVFYVPINIFVQINGSKIRSHFSQITFSTKKNNWCIPCFV